MPYTLAKNTEVILQTEKQTIDMSKLDIFTNGTFENMKFTSMAHCRTILKDDKALVWTTKCDDDYPDLEDFRLTIFKFTIEQYKEAKDLLTFMIGNATLGLDMGTPDSDEKEIQYVIVHKNRRSGKIDGQIDMRFNIDGRNVTIEKFGTDVSTVNGKTVSTGGTGIALLRTAEKIAQATGYEALVIDTALDTAQTFYAKLGYKFMDTKFRPFYMTDSSMYIPLVDINVIKVADNTLIDKIPLDNWIENPDIEFWYPTKKRTLEGDQLGPKGKRIRPSLISSMTGWLFKTETEFSYFI